MLESLCMFIYSLNVHVVFNNHYNTFLAYTSHIWPVKTGIPNPMSLCQLKQLVYSAKLCNCLYTKSTEIHDVTALEMRSWIQISRIKMVKNSDSSSSGFCEIDLMVLFKVDRFFHPSMADNREFKIPTTWTATRTSQFIPLFP